MLAPSHGQTWNGTEPARSIDVSHPTAKRCLDALADALVVRQLQPQYANAGKRRIPLLRMQKRLLTSCKNSY